MLATSRYSNKLLVKTITMSVEIIVLSEIINFVALYK